MPTFGDHLKHLRLSKNIHEQKTLAFMLKVSPGLISQIERGAFIPSSRFIKRLVEVLRLDDATEQEMQEIAALDNKRMQRRPSERLKFGLVLQDIFNKKNFTANDIDLDRSKTAIAFWINGQKLPSDKTLVNELLPLLKGMGVHPKHLQRLKDAHLEGTLNRLLELEYLKPDARTKISNCIIDCITNQKREKNQE